MHCCSLYVNGPQGGISTGTLSLRYDLNSARRGAGLPAVFRRARSARLPEAHLQRRDPPIMSWGHRGNAGGNSFRTVTHCRTYMWRRQESNPIMARNLSWRRRATSDASGCRILGYRSVRHCPRVHWSPPESPPVVEAFWRRQGRFPRPPPRMPRLRSVESRSCRAVRPEPRPDRLRLFQDHHPPRRTSAPHESS